MTTPEKPLHLRLRAAREKAGVSQPDLWRKTDGISYETVRGLEAPPTSRRHRRPSVASLAAYLKGLGLKPAEDVDYQLLRARQLLDDRPPEKGGVGREGALRNLEKVRGPLGLDDSERRDPEAINLAEGEDVGQVDERNRSAPRHQRPT